MFLRLLLLFIIVPLVEMILFLQIGVRIGLPATLGIIIITGFLGAWLTKVQGLRTLARFQKATSEGRLPHEEVMDGLMILVAGAVLLTPGFLTDTIGFLLLVPPIRTVVRRYLGRYLKGRITIRGNVAPPRPANVENRAGGGTVKNNVIDADVIDVEVVDSEEPKPADKPTGKTLTRQSDVEDK